MIAANELRIGNKVLNGADWATITGIVETATDSNVYLDKGQNACLLSNLQPVPLSKSAMEKCWFFLSEDGFWYEHIAATLYPIYLMHLNNQWQFSLTDPCAVAHWKSICWLHQLQNLYFALNGEELEMAA